MPRSHKAIMLALQSTQKEPHFSTGLDLFVVLQEKKRRWRTSRRREISGAWPISALSHTLPPTRPTAAIVTGVRQDVRESNAQATSIGSSLYSCAVQVLTLLDGREPTRRSRRAAAAFMLKGCQRAWDSSEARRLSSLFALSQSLKESLAQPCSSVTLTCAAITSR